MLCCVPYTAKELTAGRRVSAGVNCELVLHLLFLRKEDAQSHIRVDREDL